MPWTAPSILQPHLPPHCEPTTDFLHRFSAVFHTCIPTPLAFVSNTLGTLSILAWLFAQLPQIYRNYRISSTSGLSFFFLVEWCLGDSFNLIGAIFTHQASWQVAIGSYYVFVDLCLVGQWLWYEKLRHGRRVRKIMRWSGHGQESDWAREGMREGRIPVSALGQRQSEDGGQNTKSLAIPTTSRPRYIYRTPRFHRQEDDGDEQPPSSLAATPNGTTFYRIGPSTPLPSPNPRTLLLIACLIAIVRASPLQSTHSTMAKAHPTPLENAGTIVSWLSTLLYLGSRLPQLLKNYQRQSTSGLSPQLFAAAFCGNLLYSCALLTNPCAWYDFGPYGGGGWAGPQGSQRGVWVPAALPFFLGAAGVLGLDASVGVQFLLYGEAEGNVVVVVEEEAEGGKRRRWKWRRVDGWMRGWIPSSSDNGGKGEERRLLDEHSRHSGLYGSSSAS